MAAPGAHGNTYRPGQYLRALGHGFCAVARFINAHLLDHSARCQISFGQPTQMTIEMLFHLALGLDHKSKTDTISSAPGQRAQRKRACEPQGI
jgi:hypothetical protein